MNRFKALINLHNDEGLGILTKGRHIASTALLGRYAFVDFVLSNLINSGFENISLLIKEHTTSIVKHIGNPNTYLKNSKTQSLSYLVNEEGLKNNVFNTDVNNIISNDAFLYDKNTKYILICPVHYVMKVDYSEIVKEHVKSGKLISVVYKHTKNADKYLGCKKLTIDALDNAQKFEVNTGSSNEANIYLETIVINREFLKELIGKVSSISTMFNLNDLVAYVAKYIEKVHCIEFNGYVRCFNTFEKYMKYSFEMLDVNKVSNVLLNNDWPYYTTTHNTRPTLYGENSKVSSSLISNGCSINGEVKHSILGREVLVEEGATVENCILFSHVIVRKGMHIKNLVADKRVEFVNKEEVSGTIDEPLYIPRGVKI